MGFSGGSVVKNLPAMQGDVSSIPRSGRSPGGGNGNPLQYSDLENSTDCTVHGVAKSWTRLNDFDFTSLHYTYLGLPCSSVGKESTYNAGDPSLIPGSGRFTGEGIGYPHQYFWASLMAQLVKNSPAM